MLQYYNQVSLGYIMLVLLDVIVTVPHATMPSPGSIRLHYNLAGSVRRNNDSVPCHNALARLQQCTVHFELAGAVRCNNDSVPCHNALARLQQCTVHFELAGAVRCNNDSAPCLH
jgi:hypothetical protein